MHTGNCDEPEARWSWQRTVEVNWTFLWEALWNELHFAVSGQSCIGLTGKNSGAVISGLSHSRIPVRPLKEHLQTWTLTRDYCTFTRHFKITVGQRARCIKNNYWGLPLENHQKPNRVFHLTVRPSTSAPFRTIIPKEIKCFKINLFSKNKTVDLYTKTIRAGLGRWLTG